MHSAAASTLATERSAALRDKTPDGVGVLGCGEEQSIFVWSTKLFSSILDCMLLYSVKNNIMSKKSLNLPIPDLSGILPQNCSKNSEYCVKNANLHQNADFLKFNARIRYLPDEQGVYRPYELLAFPKRTFIPPGWESSDCGKRKNVDDSVNEFFDAVEDSEFSRRENKRKSFCRARNKLFDIALSTMAFDCFVTLTVDSEKCDRYDYEQIIKKLSQWLDNRVRRHGLTYVLVPEYHKDRAIHFHGLCNFDALKTVRAVSPYTGKELFDNEKRPIYNIKDFPLGINSVIPLSGENARQATAKYCYKYITKSDGEKVGGRYYLSGGNLGRPQYKLLNVDYESIPGYETKVGGIIELKKYKFKEGEELFDFLKEHRGVLREV